MYHQSQHCDQHVNWNILELGPEADNIKIVQPDRPLIRSAILRTFIFAIIYIVVNILLAVASVIAIRKIK